MSKSNALLLSFTLVLTGLSTTSILQPPQVAHSQTDYEEYLIVETDTAQELKQKNIGSGESTNINCGTNTVDTQPITTTCPSIPGETSTAPVPVVTQREGPVVTASGSGTEDMAESRAECLSDEVVTGGGWERIDTLTASQNRGIIKENKEGNAWVVTGSSTFQPVTFKAYAECLKLVSSLPVGESPSGFRGATVSNTVVGNVGGSSITVDVSCPAGSDVTGGGFEITPSDTPNIRVIENKPVDNGWRSTIQYLETSDPPQVTVFARCGAMTSLDTE